MPKYYCDYCDTFLTHDSPSVRKTHNGGRKHKENVRMYYQSWMEQQAQKLVDATARAFTQQQRLGGPRPMMPAMPQNQFPYPIVPPVMNPVATAAAAIPRPVALSQLPPLPTGPYPPQHAAFAGGVIPPLPPMPYPQENN